MKEKFSRSKIMTISHALKKVYKLPLGEAQKLAWKNAKLKNALNQGSVQFTYMKKNGELRKAVGTLHNIEYLFSGSDKFQNDNLTLRYYDLEKNDFRAMKIKNLVLINY